MNFITQHLRCLHSHNLFANNVSASSETRRQLQLIYVTREIDIFNSSLPELSENINDIILGAQARYHDFLTGISTDDNQEIITAIEKIENTIVDQIPLKMLGASLLRTNLIYSLSIECQRQYAQVSSELDDYLKGMKLIAGASLVSEGLSLLLINKFIVNLNSTRDDYFLAPTEHNQKHNSNLIQFDTLLLK